MIDEPRVVEAGRGAAWWGEGWRIFASNFWTWIGIMIIYIIITMMISLVPYVGSFGHWLLTPVFVGGLMLGCRAIDHDEPLRVAHLFEGFQGAHFVPLMIIGAVNIAITVVIAALGVAAVAGGMSLAGLMQSGAMGDPLAALGGMANAFTGTGLLLILIAVVIVAIFAMLNWFAPALVALDGATAWEAMKLSLLLVPAQLGAVSRLWLDRNRHTRSRPPLAIWRTRIAVRCERDGRRRRRLGSRCSASSLLFFLVSAVFALVVGPIVFGSHYAGYKDTLAVEERDPDEYRAAQPISR